MTGFTRTISVLVGLIANLIPLYGILYWQWDAFQLLMLYWMETVIMAFWTVRRIARLPEDQLGTITVNGHARPATHRMLCGFFILHASLFILLHLLFLWLLFSREWLRKVHGFSSFMNELFVTNGLWMALIFMFAAGWISYRSESSAYPRAMERARYPKKTFAPASGASSRAVDSVVGGLYVRIGIMQVAIIAGGLFAKSYHSIVPLLIVIGLKTLADIGATIRGFLIERMTTSPGNVSIKS